MTYEEEFEQFRKEREKERLERFIRRTLVLAGNMGWTNYQAAMVLLGHPLPAEDTDENTQLRELASPSIEEQIRKARADGYSAGFDDGFAVARIEAARMLSRRNDLETFMMLEGAEQYRNVHKYSFYDSFDEIVKELAESLRMPIDEVKRLFIPGSMSWDEVRSYLYR